MTIRVASDHLNGRAGRVREREGNIHLRQRVSASRAIPRHNLPRVSSLRASIPSALQCISRVLSVLNFGCSFSNHGWTKYCAIVCDVVESGCCRDKNDDRGETSRGRRPLTGNLESFAT